ncbi:hypothetical protein P7K49_035507, partial [Saguinus oedipus]
SGTEDVNPYPLNPRRGSKGLCSCQAGVFRSARGLMSHSTSAYAVNWSLLAVNPMVAVM